MTPESAAASLLSTRRTTIDELAAAQGVEPMVSTEEWAADDIFESDEEHEAFLVDFRALGLRSRADRWGRRSGPRSRR